MAEQYNFHGFLLVPATEAFNNVTGGIKLQYVGGLTNGNQTIDVLLVNVKDTKEIPDALKTEQDLLTKAITEKEGKQESTGGLPQQLAFVNSLKEQFDQSVYHKDVPDGLLNVVNSSGLPGAQRAAKDVVFLNGISSMTK